MRVLKQTLRHVTQLCAEEWSSEFNLFNFLYSNSVTVTYVVLRELGLGVLHIE